MGDITKNLYKKAKERGKVNNNSTPFLKLAERKEGQGVVGLGPKKLRLEQEKVVKGREYKTNKERKEVEYLFTELDTGEKKRYRKPIHDQDGNLHYLHENMKDFKVGDSLIIEFKEKDNSYGGYLDVSPLNEEEDFSEPENEEPDTEDIDEDDIPVINEDEEDDEEIKF